jgi:hypothetical protein
VWMEEAKDCLISAFGISGAEPLGSATRQCYFSHKIN